MSKAAGILETAGLAISIEAMDAMLKITEINLIHQEVEDIELVTLWIEGDATSVKIALQMGESVAKKAGLFFASSIILNPEPNVKKLIRKGVKNGETFI